MSPRLAQALLALAAIPPAYACFVYGWQIVGFGSMATRLDEDLPGEAWRSIAVTGLKMVGLAVALFIVWRGASRGRWRPALIALLAGWVVAAPLFWMVLRG